MRAGPLLFTLVAVTLVLTAYNTFTASQDGGLLPGNSAAPTQLAEIEERLGRIEERLDGLRVDVRSASREQSALRRAVAAGGGADGGAVDGEASDGDDAAPRPGASARSATDLEDAVAARVEKTLARLAERERYRGPDGQWKPPVEALRRTLEADATQSEALGRVFDGARDEAFALLTTRRADGGTFLDDIVESLRAGEPEGKAWGGVLARLAQEQVPGRGRTYLEAFGEMSERIRADAERNMRPEQVQLFRELNVDVFDVKTGHDPIGAYVLERLGRSE